MGWIVLVQSWRLVRVVAQMVQRRCFLQQFWRSAPTFWAIGSRINNGGRFGRSSFFCQSILTHWRRKRSGGTRRGSDRRRGTHLICTLTSTDRSLWHRLHTTCCYDTFSEATWLASRKYILFGRRGSSGRRG